ncbi:hypothetical protein M0813_05308 [Anaeramoeba flamelloides]|uniref:LNR domain-containing protein n=1 Tax=Anaeramoeba flamelloides TaxID=1746091 RepID=A0ABQ8XHL7_9EUKA|nr:hypothetical protein M0813_05308 [Anaeramoeba flamelloides]
MIKQDLKKTLQLKTLRIISSRRGFSNFLYSSSVVVFLLFLFIFCFLRILYLNKSETNEFTNTISGTNIHDYLPEYEFDVVYTWVNGSDPSHQKKMIETKLQYLEGFAAMCNKTEAICDPTAFAKNRWRDHDELKYSLRSIEKYVPWVRNIYIVTNGQVPSWVNLKNPRIKIVTHAEIFSNQSHLPTFASPAIETHLHNISGISKHFIYLNDDFLFFSPIYPDTFLSVSNGQKIYLAWAVPDCQPGCPYSWIGDGFCDLTCNNSACDFDGGDCINYTAPSGYGDTGWNHYSEYQNRRNEKIPYASRFCFPGCLNSWLGDNYCDSTCNRLDCAFDGGDCGTDDLFKYATGFDPGENINQNKSNPFNFYIEDIHHACYINLTKLVGESSEIVTFNHSSETIVRRLNIENKKKVLILTFLRNVTRTNFTVMVNVNELNVTKSYTFEISVSTLINNTQQNTEKEEESNNGEDIDNGGDEGFNDEKNVNDEFNDYNDGRNGDDNKNEKFNEGKNVNDKFNDEDNSNNDDNNKNGNEKFNDENNVNDEFNDDDDSNGDDNKNVNNNCNGENGNDNCNDENGNENVNSKNRNGNDKDKEIDNCNDEYCNDKFNGDDNNKNDNFDHNINSKKNEDSNIENDKKIMESERNGNGNGNKKKTENEREIKMEIEIENETENEKTAFSESESENDLMESESENENENESESESEDEIENKDQDEKVKEITDEIEDVIEDETIFKSNRKLLTVSQQNKKNIKFETKKLNFQAKKIKKLKKQLLLENDINPLLENEIIKRDRYKDYEINFEEYEKFKKNEEKKLQGIKNLGGRKLLDTYSESLKFVSKLYNKEYGQENRHVPAHAPILINRDVIKDLHSKYPKLIDLTSSRKFRHPHNMQYQFSYIYFLIHEKRKFDLDEYFKTEFDLDSDGELNESEFRILALHVHDTVNKKILKNLKEEIYNCSIINSSNTHNTHNNNNHNNNDDTDGADDDDSTTIVQKYPSIEDMKITVDSLRNCSQILERLNKTCQQTPKYPHETIDYNNNGGFVQLFSNQTINLKKLDHLRKSNLPFICLNDDLNYTQPETVKVIQDVSNFLHTFFPNPSQFELPEGQVNPYLNVEEMKLYFQKMEKEKKYRKLFYYFVFSFVLIIFIMLSIFLRKRNKKKKGIKRVLFV